MTKLSYLEAIRQAHDLALGKDKTHLFLEKMLVKRWRFRRNTRFTK